MLCYPQTSLGPELLATWGGGGGGHRSNSSICFVRLTQLKARWELAPFLSTWEMRELWDGTLRALWEEGLISWKFGGWAPHWLLHSQRNTTDLPLTFTCFPTLLSKPCLPQIPNCCHSNSSQTLSAARCYCSQTFGAPLKSPFPQAGHRRDLAQMAHDTHFQPGPEAGAGSGQTDESLQM